VPLKKTALTTSTKRLRVCDSLKWIFSLLILVPVLADRSATTGTFALLQISTFLTKDISLTKERYCLSIMKILLLLVAVISLDEKKYTSVPVLHQDLYLRCDYLIHTLIILQLPARCVLKVLCGSSWKWEISASRQPSRVKERSVSKVCKTFIYLIGTSRLVLPFSYIVHYVKCKTVL